MTSQITPEDIESKFRDVAEQVEGVADSSKKKAMLGGAGFALIMFVIFYLLGRKTGKKKSSVMEIRRL